MRILWVKVGGLWPLNSGGRLRSYHVVSELARRHRVTVVTTHGSADDAAALPKQLAHCERVLSLPLDPPKHGSARFAAALAGSWTSPLPVDLWRYRDRGVAERVRTLLGDADLCIADFLVAAPLVPLRGPVPVVHFSHNVEHMIWKRLCGAERRPWCRALLEIEWRKMRRYEATACRDASLTLAVSDADRDRLRQCAPGARIESIPTGVDTSYFRPQPEAERPPRIVFTGSMDWYPNEDAITWFVAEILPRIRRVVPQASFTVVGRNPGARVRALASAAGVAVTGTVADVRPYMAEAAVYVVPLRIGGGTRLKIFEALAMGKAVVSTAIGAEGLPLAHERQIWLADGAESFAAGVVGLLRDAERRRLIGNAGRALVERRYSWSRVASEFEARCLEVMSSHESEHLRTRLCGIGDGRLPRASGA